MACYTTLADGSKVDEDPSLVAFSDKFQNGKPIHLIPGRTNPTDFQEFFFRPRRLDGDGFNGLVRQDAVSCLAMKLSEILL